MIFDTVVVGPLGVNCFILGCEESREGVVVDPGADAERILERVRSRGLDIRYVVNTHGHFDHVGGNRRLVAATGAKLLIHRDDVPLLGRAVEVAANYGLTTERSPEPDLFLEDGAVLSFGSCAMEILHTPGHTPGGCCLSLATEAKVITGDTLFAESVGRTDFPGSSHEALMASIQTKLLPLPDATQVFPGHGPSTTIGRERLYNPYIAG
ncbi:MBL fold metallo-hydrolase [Geobacter pickeringii]|uniref:Beta-lactamase n=1 Tax=Geobacter pickeringii TaxID=345632 RepID=A0A0B5BB93_9BACT|nr:MBL fold metallo-hydrolase [Geobacter pickeringii]AJE03817.1 beta-lactamase [Geobacter pickeringii]